MDSTDQTSAPTQPTPAALRKRQQRARQRAAGVVAMTVDVPQARVADLRHLAASLCREPNLPLLAAGMAEQLAAVEEEARRDAAADVDVLRGRLADAEQRAAVAAGREAAMAEQAEAARREARALAVELAATRAVVQGHRADAVALIALARLGRLVKVATGWRAKMARWLLRVPHASFAAL